MRNSLQDKIEEIKQNSNNKIKEDPIKFFCCWALMKHIQDTLMDEQGTMPIEIYDQLKKTLKNYENMSLSDIIKEVLQLSPLY